MTGNQKSRYCGKNAPESAGYAPRYTQVCLKGEKPVLGYFGGKWSLLPEILKFFAFIRRAAL